jgi:alkylated DNA repair dioxygenase AlkB
MASGEQLSLLDSSPAAPDQPGRPQAFERPGLRLRHWPCWLVKADDWMQRLEAEVPWRQEHITLWGRTHPLPRLTCWMGDPGCTYTYSGVKNKIEPWSPSVSYLRDMVEDALGASFNSLLLNHYRDGRD